MQEQEIHLRDYLRVIRKRKAIVITFFLATFVVVATATLTTTPRYTATTKILVEKNDSNPLGRLYYYAQQDPEFIATQSQIVTSRRVALKVVRLLNLEQDYAAYFPEQEGSKGLVSVFREQLRQWAGALRDLAGQPEDGEVAAPAVADPGEPAYSAREEAIADMIRDEIVVNPVQESRVIEITFSSENPQYARQVANTIAKAYMEELLEIKMNTSGYTIKWMTAKAEEERAKLQQSERDLQAYMKANDIITIEDRIAILPQKLAEFSSQLSRAESRRKELYSVYHQLEQARDGEDATALESIPSILNDRSVQALRDALAKAEQNVEELGKKYGPKHPVMINAVAEREALRAKKNAELLRVTASIKNEYELAQANEDNIRGLLATTKAEAMRLNEKFVQYTTMKRDVEANRSLYEALLARLKEQGVTEESQNVNVWIVEEAETPLHPSSPRIPRNLLLGLVLGLFGGVGFAFFIEYLDNTVKSPEDAEEQLGLAMLGVINTFAVAKKGPLGDELVSLRSQRSVIGENFKALRTALLLSNPDGPPKSVVVTSVLPGEGKTVCAVNLAITVAQAGQRVLLIDGDMRKPRVHKILKLENRQGLSTFLAGAQEGNMTQAGPVENLSVITAGPIPPNPSELLSSVNLEKLIGKSQEAFDLVIFDSAPVVSVTDTLVISKMVDGVMVVARAGRTTYEAAAQGIKKLAAIKSNILGLVLNDFDARKYRYYYGEYYQQYYGQYYGDAS